MLRIYLVAMAEYLYMENEEQKNVEETTVNNQEEVKETVETVETTEVAEVTEVVETVEAPVVEKKEKAIASFSGDIESRVYTFAELEAASEDYTDDEFNDMATMYESTLSSIDEKEIVTGRVVSIDEKYVVVDIGFKSEGIIFTNEFSAKTLETLKLGDEIEVFLDRVEDKDGQLILSRRKADILQAWEKIEAAHETEIIIDGFIKRRIKGGMVVDVYGIDAFLPGSQIDVRPVRDFDAYVGKTMEFKVVKLNMRAENVVVSHRALIESDLEEQREKILDSITPGQVLEGTVKNITDFGVFIDLGGVDGLLHITDLSWGRVENPSEIVQLDQKMNVAVIDYDQKSKRVSLGLKQLQPHPWDEIDYKYPEGGRVQGRVVSIADYGAFIELEKGIEGLIHISEMSWTQHIKHPSQLVQKDDIIECVVLSVNKDERKISLGVKQLENDPWSDIEERYPINSTHKGTIRNLTNFGVFVELEPGIDGLIHISDLSWTEKVTHPSEIVEKGQEIEAKILAIDFDNRRITLGHKQVTDNPWDSYHETYSPGTVIEATVSKVTEKGVHVKLQIGIDAFIPANKMITDSAELKEGEVINATVTNLDEENKFIELSQDIKEIGKLKTAIKKAEAKKSEITGTPTLGEMSGLADLKRKMEAQEKEEKEEE